MTARLRARHPDASLELRDLAREPHPGLDDALIAQLKRADLIVLGVPMYNFNVSVQIKSWIDAIARAGQTFRDTPLDSQVPYLKGVLGLMGMNDVEFIYAEGVNMGPERASAAFDEVEAQLAALV